MEKMRTAKEMLSYFYANKTGGGMGRDKSLACFRLIERRLEADEYALITFTASHYNENLRNEGYYGHAVTNKRILMAKQDSKPAFKMIPLSEFNGITVTCGKYFASILLDAAGMQLRVETTMPEAKTIQELFISALNELKWEPKALPAAPHIVFQGCQGGTLRTAEEMLQYCKDNHTGTGLKRSKALKYFEIIEECLEPGETIAFAFTAGQHNTETESGDDYAVAVSNKRILMGREGIICGRVFRFISFNELNYITATSEGGSTEVAVDSAKMQLCMEASAAAGEKVRELFQEILMEPGQEKELPQKEPDEEPEEMQLPDIAEEYEKEYEEGHAWQMKTAEEMTRYFEINGTGDGISETKDLKYFRIIEECLEPDEYVIFTFMACHFSVNSEWEDSFANAITNKRLLMCKQVFFSGPILKVVPLEELNDIIITEGKAFSSIIVDSTKLQIRMETTVSGGKEIQKRLPTILDEIKKRNRELRIPKAVLASPADEIRKYKGLLDDGAITEAEYEIIKKELMKQAFTD